MSISLCSQDDVESDMIDPWLIDSQECITILSYFLCWDVVISYLTYLLKRPLIRGDQMWYKYQSQEAGNTFITTGGSVFYITAT
jgi:hypothetical protein